MTSTHPIDKNDERKVHSDKCIDHVVCPPDAIEVLSDGLTDDAKSILAKILLFSRTMSAYLQEGEYREACNANQTHPETNQNACDLNQDLSRWSELAWERRRTSRA